MSSSEFGPPPLITPHVSAGTSALALLLALPVLACAQPQMFEAVEPHMGTLVRITLYAADGVAAERAFRKAFDRIAELDEILSDYKAGSEVNRLCRDGAGHPVKVSSDLFRVLEIAQEISEKSGGAFDVTLGPVTRLWRQRRVPDATVLQEARKHTGFRKVHLNPADRTVRLDEDGMQLDLGGIGKGYAAEEALTVLKNAGMASALVAVSGDLAIGDAPPGKPGWTIAIPNGLAAPLKNSAVSSSGDQEQHVDSGGMRYSHIIDPATGMGLTKSPTITVFAPHGAYADALSTAVCVLGAERGRELIKQFERTTLRVH